MCIFCEIVQRKQPADIVHENATVIAFRDIHPKAPVHILIVSKKHIASVKEVEREDCGLLVDILCAAKEIAKIQKVDEGYKLIFNVGRKGGQVIDHLHLHLLGGF